MYVICKYFLPAGLFILLIVFICALQIVLHVASSLIFLTFFFPLWIPGKPVYVSWDQNSQKVGTDGI